MSRLPHFRVLRACCALLLVGAGLFMIYMTVGAQDPPMKPNVGFTETGVTVSEKAGYVTLTVALSNSYTDTVTVQYGTSAGTATSGSDYTATSGTLTFPAGLTSQTVEVEIIDDGTGESLEWFSVTLSNATNAAGIDPSSCTVSIDDGYGSKSANVSFDYASWTYNEDDGTATISVTMTGSPSGTVTVDWATSNGTATSGSDYTSGSGTLTWLSSEAGQSKTFTVTLLTDAVSEPTETVILTLSNPVNATITPQGTAFLNIIDDDEDCPD